MRKATPIVERVIDPTFRHLEFWGPDERNCPCECRKCGKFARAVDFPSKSRVRFMPGLTRAYGPECAECNKKRLRQRRKDVAPVRARERAELDLLPASEQKAARRAFNEKWYGPFKLRGEKRRYTWSKIGTVRGYEDKPCKCTSCATVKTVNDFPPSYVQVGRNAESRYYDEWNYDAFKGARCRDCHAAYRRRQKQNGTTPPDYGQPLDARAGCKRCGQIKTVKEMEYQKVVEYGKKDPTLLVYSCCKKCHADRSLRGAGIEPQKAPIASSATP